MRIGTCHVCGRADVAIGRGGQLITHSIEAGKIRNAPDHASAALRAAKCAGSGQPTGIAPAKVRRTVGISPLERVTPVPPATATELYKANAVRDHLGKAWTVTLDRGEITCRPVGRMYSEAAVTYEQLVSISAICGTRDINLSHKEGWGGSDVTPGDPDEFAIVIKL